MLSFVELESRLAGVRADMDKIDSVLVALELKGVALAEQVPERLDAARGWLKAFIKKTTKESMQFAMALMRSYYLEADLDPVGEGTMADCTDNEWEAHFTTIGPLAEPDAGRKQYLFWM